MTTIEANAIVKAREEMKRAKKELAACHSCKRLRYRGIPTTAITTGFVTPIHGSFTYRGVEYTK